MQFNARFADELGLRHYYWPHMQSAALAAASEIERIDKRYTFRAEWEDAVRRLDDTICERNSILSGYAKTIDGLRADRDAWKKRAEQAEASEVTALRTIGLYQDRVIADIELLIRWQKTYCSAKCPDECVITNDRERALHLDTLARLDKRAAQGGA